MKTLLLIFILLGLLIMYGFTEPIEVTVKFGDGQVIVVPIAPSQQLAAQLGIAIGLFLFLLLMSAVGQPLANAFKKVGTEMFLSDRSRSVEDVEFREHYDGPTRSRGKEEAEIDF